MKIQGLQKMTLLDYPGRVACTVFLGGCDFRCPFCHNFDLVEGPMPAAVDDGEFFAFLAKRRGLLDGVAITGGEPCLRADLPDFIGKIREAGFDVKLDTNGNHPGMLAHLVGEGLVNYVAMDVKNAPAKYAATVGLTSVDLAPIDESIGLLLAGKVPYEFRTTVVGGLHEANDFEEIGAWIEGAERYYLQAFVENDAVPNRELTAPHLDAMREFRDIAARHVKTVELRGIED